ncbi:MAG: bifunctional hydroxymethylpyrimidine kinase/phosphomethylpyrimidine kinase, partial [Muribaculaceae bacterium]|nr:bifunctional hydroxymethylpyrimidine kinase/phosphomethylpyrimidine kinase [Muribaculaceae bacterium]
MMPIVLCISGSDNTAGAGMQADIKTCCALSCYPVSVIT